MSLLSMFGLQAIPTVDSGAAIADPTKGHPVHLNLDYSSKLGMRRIVQRVIRLRMALATPNLTAELHTAYMAELSKKDALMYLNGIELPHTISELEIMLEELI